MREEGPTQPIISNTGIEIKEALRNSTSASMEIDEEVNLETKVNKLPNVD